MLSFKDLAKKRSETVEGKFNKKFIRTIKTKLTKKQQFKIGKKTFKFSYNESYRWSGYAMMKRVKEFAKKYPSIKITKVDDHAFAGSYLVFVPVKGMGHYVYYIPQCTGEQPVKFFMYPNHLKALKETLRKIKPMKELA